MPVGLAEAKLLMLVDRASGDMLGVTLFDSEEALRKGDEAMNAGPGNAGSRAFDFYRGATPHSLGTFANTGACK